MNQRDIDSAHDAYVLDVIIAAEAKLGRHLTEQERKPFRAISFISLEVLYREFTDAATTAEDVEKTVEYILTHDRPSLRVRKQPLWRRLLGL